MIKHFTKNDSGFTCMHCGASVVPLKTSSRDHCTQCLHGLHVDINPGDRKNECKGLLVPVGVAADTKKGYVIEYRCSKCGVKLRNKAAADDNFEAMLKICSQSGLA